MEVQSEQQNNLSEEQNSHGPQAQTSVEDGVVNVGTASNNVEATTTAEVQVSTVPGRIFFLFFVSFYAETENGDISLFQIQLQKFRQLRINMAMAKDLKTVMRTRRRLLKNPHVEDTTNAEKLSNIGVCCLFDAKYDNWSLI